MKCFSCSFFSPFCSLFFAEYLYLYSFRKQHHCTHVETLWMLDLNSIWFIFFSPPGLANCYFNMVICCSVQALRGLFPCSSFMWFNEVSGEWLSLCLLSCNSSALIAWFCLARSLTRCWTYVFVSPLAEHVVLFVTGSSGVTDCPAGAAWTSSRVRCLFRLRHRGAAPDPDSYAN